MPPKKKQKVLSNSKITQPQTVGEVAPARLYLRDWIAQVYQGRHGFDQEMKWPLGKGGSFLDVVQRVWSDETTLVFASLDLVKKLGLMDSSATDDDFHQKYLQLKDFIPQRLYVNLCFKQSRLSQKR